MMNSISPLDTGASKGHYVGASGNGPRDAGGVGGRTNGMRSAPPLGISDTASPANFGDMIGEMLQGIGGDLQNNKMLQLLIGLMILLTLLEGSSQGGGSASDPLSGLGGSEAGGGLESYAGFAASSTSITIEHTSISMTASAVETMAASEDNGQSQGGTIDFAA